MSAVIKELNNVALSDIKELAVKRRALRWAKERAAEREAEAHKKLVAAIAASKNVKPAQIKLSNTYCNKAPADLHCTFVESHNPLRNSCLFCGGFEEDPFC